MPSNLREQVDPQTVDIYQKTKDGLMTPKLDQQVTGKLNPRWVETLMGLPIGWVMPSCVSPLTIAPTNCDCLATELYQLPQPELF